MTGQPPHGRLCRGCGTYLDLAATKDHDGNPYAYDRHPGCEPGGQQLRLIKGASK